MTPAKSVLSPGTRRDVRAFAEALFSRDGTAPPGERIAWLVDDVDDFVSHLNLRAALLFRLCLFVVSVVAPVLKGRPKRLSALSMNDRLEALEALERSPASLALFGARAILSLCYYEHPDAAREIGWDRTCLGASKRETSREAESQGNTLGAAS